MFLVVLGVNFLVLGLIFEVPLVLIGRFYAYSIKLILFSVGWFLARFMRSLLLSFGWFKACFLRFGDY